MARASRAVSRRRRSVAVAVVAALVAWAALVQVTLSVFSSVTASTGNSLTALSLDPYVPASVTASRVSATTCTVTWTASAAAGAPATLTYDVTDGVSTTLATAVSGTSATVTVPATATTPTVYARAGAWRSATATTSSTPCVGVPDAPASVTVTAGDTLLVVSWAAPSGNGSAVTGYTVTATPTGGGTPSTCTPSPATATSCAITGLSNGNSYAVTVSAASANGAGPASAPVYGTPVAGQLLDGLTSPSLGAWSVRKLRTSYAGSAMTVRRASDDTTTTIGYAAGGDLDTTALTSFCAATSCYVLTWFDQSGHGYDLTQTTNSAQPRIVNAGVVELVGGRPSLAFSGAQQLANGASAVTLGTTALTGNVVAYGSAGSAYAGRFLGFTANGQANDWDNASSAEMLRLDYSGVVNGGRNWTSLASVSATTTALGDYTMIYNGSSATIYAGATAGSSGASSGSFGATGSFHTGANTLADANSLLTGAVSEITTFALALPGTDRTSLAGNQSAYFLLPGPPTGLAAAQGDTTSTVTWTAPGRPGASSVTGYTVTAVPTDGTLPTRTCTATAPTTTCALTGLTNGATYTVQVRATNSVGTGTASASVTLVPRPALLAGANAQLWLDGGDPDGDGTMMASAENCDTGTSCASLSNVLKRWKDKSGKAHDAVQATGAMAGTYTPASGAVTFNANGYYQAGSVGVGPDVTAFVVAQSATGGWNQPGWLLGSRAASGFVVHPDGGGYSTTKAIALWGSGTNVQAVNTVAQGSGSLASLHLFDAQVSGTSTVSANSALDGIIGATGTATGGTARAATTVTVTIGADDFDLAIRRGQGAYRELVVLDRALTATERRTVQEYLARRWGVTIAPATPTGLTATAGDTTATLSWTAPSWNGGAAVTGYTATAVPSDGALSTVTCTSASTGCTLTGMTNGVTYTVTVKATNSVGSSAASSSVTVIPYPATVMTSSAVKLWLDGADSATLFASSGCTGAAATTTIGCWKDKSASANNATQATGSLQPVLSASASWSVPTFDGSDDTLAASAATLPTGTTPSTEFVVARLTDPSPASSGVRAVTIWGTAAATQSRIVNKLGSGTTVNADTWSANSAQTGAWPSNANTLVAAEAATPTMRISQNGSAWVTSASAAFSTGTTGMAIGSTIGGGGAQWYGSVSELVVVNTTLTTAQRRQVEEYLARKWGVNVTPSAPTALTGSVGDSQATLSWTAPAWNGGSTITGYTVTASPGGATCTATFPTATCTVTGLTNGTGYTFTATATNAIGTGPASAATTTLTPPGPPAPSPASPSPRATPSSASRGPRPEPAAPTRSTRPPGRRPTTPWPPAPAPPRRRPRRAP